MQVIIINGASATGKTTLAKYMSKRLGYKVIYKDRLKESLVDPAKRPPNLRNFLYYDKAAFKKLYEELDVRLKTSQSVIVEAAFSQPQHKTLAKILKSYDVKEIYCKTWSWILLKRFIKRSESRKSHPVHQARFWYALLILGAPFPIWPRVLNPPMKFVKKRLVVDTTKPELIDYQKILGFIKSG